CRAPPPAPSRAEAGRALCTPCNDVSSVAAADLHSGKDAPQLGRHVLAADRPEFGSFACRAAPACEHLKPGSGRHHVAGPERRVARDVHGRKAEPIPPLPPPIPHPPLPPDEAMT